MADSVLFTVFTPTYNRAHTLHRVYDSLCAQTLRDFEWLVIDDGSTDGTADLIANWAKSADFPIRYFKQEHSGRHGAGGLDDVDGLADGGAGGDHVIDDEHATLQGAADDGPAEAS